MPEQAEPELRGAVPPNSLEAEISVLGAMLQDSSVVLRAMESLQPEDFYLPEHQEIFRAMADLARAHRPIDLTTAVSEMSRRGSLEGVGGVPYLMRLMSSVPTVVNAGAYVELVQEKSTLRKLISASQGIAREAYAQQSPLPEILAGAEKAIFDIAMNRTDGGTLKHVREVLDNTFREIEELSRLHGEVSGVPTGFIDVDSTLTGLHPGELIILGARPAMGKTSFAMNIASYASIEKGKTVAVFSLEMPREQIVMRVLCGQARVNMQKVRKGTLEDAEWITRQDADAEGGEEAKGAVTGRILNMVEENDMNLRTVRSQLQLTSPLPIESIPFYNVLMFSTDTVIRALRIAQAGENVIVCQGGPDRLRSVISMHESRLENHEVALDDLMDVFEEIRKKRG